MSRPNLDAVRNQAEDLRKNEPRSPEEELGGYPLGLRALDKCRATLVGWNGDFEFNCPMDQEFFDETGIDAEDFRDAVATGASDEDMDDWVRERAGR